LETTEINGVPFKPADSNGLANGASLAETFDNFLILLTSQLQNQDPLEPLDSNEFTQQLVQFTGVELSLKTNDKLDDLIALQGGNQLTQAVNFVGKTISADSLTLNLENGQATMTYDLSASANSASIVVLNEAGTVVKSFSAPTDFGHHEITWDGTDNDGNPVADGAYGFLISAVDAENTQVPLVQGTKGRVTSIKQDGKDTVLMLGDLEINLKDVLSIGLAENSGRA